MAFLKEYPIGKVLLNIEQARELVGVSRRTMYNWINTNKIDYVRTTSGSIRVVQDTLFRTEDDSESKKNNYYNKKRLNV